MNARRSARSLPRHNIIDQNTSQNHFTFPSRHSHKHTKPQPIDLPPSHRKLPTPTTTADNNKVPATPYKCRYWKGITIGERRWGCSWEQPQLLTANRLHKPWARRSLSRDWDAKTWTSTMNHTRYVCTHPNTHTDPPHWQQLFTRALSYCLVLLCVVGDGC